MNVECSECGREATWQEHDAWFNGHTEDGHIPNECDTWECPACEAIRCDSCGKHEEAVRESDYFECGDCQSNRNEAAYDSWLSDYYGGSTPQTIDEQHRAAWEQKRALKS